MGIADAESAEHATSSQNIIIAPVACPVPDRRDGAPKLSGACKLRIKPVCRLAAIYRASEIDEEYFCNFEVNPAYHQRMENAGLRAAALGPAGELRTVELPEHPFFIATQSQPQFSSTDERPHPVIVEFVAAAARQGS